MSIDELALKLEELEKGNEYKRRENRLFQGYLARKKREESLQEGTQEEETKGEGKR